MPSLGAPADARGARARRPRRSARVGVHAPIGGATARRARRAHLGASSARTDFDDPLLELALYTKRPRHRRAARRGVARRARSTSTEGLASAPCRRRARGHRARPRTTSRSASAHRDFARVAVGAEERPRRAGSPLHALGERRVPRHRPEPGRAPATSSSRRAASASRSGRQRLRFVANVGRYVRVPTLGEVYGASGAVHGNPALAPEAGYTADLGRPRAGRRAGPRLRRRLRRRVRVRALGRWAHRLRAHRAGLRHAVQRRQRARARRRAARGASRSRRRSSASRSRRPSLDPRDTSRRGARRSTTSCPTARASSRRPRLRADWRRGAATGVERGRRRGRAPSTSRAATPTRRASASSAEQTTRRRSRSTSRGSTGCSRLRVRVADLFDAVRTDIIGYPLPGRSIYFGLEASW